jgi:hypothetical protein
MSRPALPGGRGKRVGPDAVIDQRESELLRQTTMPGIAGMCYANDRHLIGVVPGQTDYNLAVGNVYFSPARPPEQAVEAGVVGTWTNGVGGDPAYLDVGLYAFNRQQRLLTLLPNSTARMLWTAATVGNQRINLARTLTVQPVDSLYFFACRPITNDISIWATACYLGGVDIYPWYIVHDVNQPLPGNVRFDTLVTMDPVNLHPVFGYFSSAWSAVL